MNTASEARAEPPTFFQRHWRWFVLGTLFYATFLNYLDRQTLSVAMDPIAREFGLNLMQRGKLLATFLYAYAFCHLFIGFALDRIKNVRGFFAVMLVGWSFVTLLTGFVRTYTEMRVLRALLGVFECINFPVCVLIISRIFPREQRALASGIFSSGSVFATLVAPKLVIFLANQFHWRWAFFVPAALGLTWLIPWWIIFRRPEFYSESWRNAIQALDSKSVDVSWSLASVLRRPAFWAVLAVGIGMVPGGYFFSQWLPSYFTEEWKVPFTQALGNRLSLVYLAQDLGLWLGGWFALRLAAGGDAVGGRRKVIFASYALAMAMMALPFTRSLNLATGLICAYVFGLGAWAANMSAFKQEVNNSRVATVVALVAFCETGFSAFVVDKVGTLATAMGGFNVVFVMLGAFLTFSVVVVFTLCRPRFFTESSATAKIS